MLKTNSAALWDDYPAAEQGRGVNEAWELVIIEDGLWDL